MLTLLLVLIAILTLTFSFSLGAYLAFFKLKTENKAIKSLAFVTSGLLITFLALILEVFILWP